MVTCDDLWRCVVAERADRVRLQVWLPVELADRLVLAAQENERPVSRELAKRLRESLDRDQAAVR